MSGMSLGLIVEGAVALLLAVTIGYCMILDRRLKRLHADRETMQKMVTDLVQATALANAAVNELKTAALESDARLSERITEATALNTRLAGDVATGMQLIEKIARITAAAKSQPLPEVAVEASEPPRHAPAQQVEAQGKLASALQQLAMRPGIGGRAA
jgi:hypothetical protein